MTKKPTIAILGAGSWGTAVAIHLAKGGSRINLWSREKKHIEQMQAERSNPAFLPDLPFPKHLYLSHSLKTCLKDAGVVIIAVPSHAFASVLSLLPPTIQGISWLTKGIDPQSNKLLSQLVENRWGSQFPHAIISGPSFAKEVAQGLPTALLVAGNLRSYLETLRSLFHHENVRVYLTEDAIGVQVCGAVKNVLAIACGISDGMHFGANAKAALITRGLAEMSQLGMRMGGRQETFMGLAGLGDLVLTCTDDQSRNRRFGLLLGQGVPRLEAQKQIGHVVEGAYNAAQVSELSLQFQVDMPITKAVNAILEGSMTAHQAVSHLMSRPPRIEDG